MTRRTKAWLGYSAAWLPLFVFYVYLIMNPRPALARPDPEQEGHRAVIEEVHRLVPGRVDDLDGEVGLGEEEQLRHHAGEAGEADRAQRGRGADVDAHGFADCAGCGAGARS